ncbi:hypothetical protein [Devosia psychrophila]|uniref:Uncharacterized protein n=1 Tax=Devosia psychrophila TaxID=728005 RepID=A0A0F5Q2V9_9HYPH|nr:hypothetical protein [Devosia psychrophila]KKC34966.1 hypothetical protein WH91_00005 [Devosia psychrophila]SFD46519.1 hypothetical protein SAMN04488059_1704 [Devosia psychrophila]
MDENMLQSMEPLEQPRRIKRGFMSFKCSSPITFPDRCCRDLLIQATLDRQVQSLAPSTWTDFCSSDAYFSFEAVMGGKRCLIEVCDATNAKPFEPPNRYDLGLTLSRTAILAEPRLSSARTIWACREMQVPLQFQFELIRFLTPHEKGLRLSDLESLLNLELSKWISQAPALVCRGTLQVESVSRINGQTRLSL